MSDVALNNSGGDSNTSFSMKLRPRRSALSDISNSIAQKFTNITQKVMATNTKKRKMTVGALCFDVFFLILTSNYLCYCNSG